jgi:abortive infection bacteriophage resistance protein
LQALSIEELLRGLQNRGLVIEDSKGALRAIRAIGYYRLRPFWLRFQGPIKIENQRPFVSHASFDEVLGDYQTDAALRKFLREGIETIEVAMRSAIVSALGRYYGPSALTDVEVFRENQKSRLGNHALTIREKLEKQQNRIDHLSAYRTRHSTMLDYPIWVACEALDFADLSMVFTELKEEAVKAELANEFCGTLHRHNELRQIIHQASVIRNYCAHQGRIWDRIPDPHYWVPRHLDGEIVFPHTSRNKNTGKPTHGHIVANPYGVLTVWADLFSHIALSNDWRRRVFEWASSLTGERLRILGFHEAWQSAGTWSDAPDILH